MALIMDPDNCRDTLAHIDEHRLHAIEPEREEWSEGAYDVMTDLLLPAYPTKTAQDN